MTRIFVTLTIFSLALMFAALFVGLMMEDLHAEVVEPAALRWATAHRLTGLAAALSVVLVHSIVVTYLIGTSRWCKEVVQTYALPAELIRRSATIKRQTFPWALSAMLVVVGVIALGAASDPGTGRPDTAAWTHWHFLAALAGLAWIAAASYAEWLYIQNNHRLIDEVMQEVEEVRRQRGLPVGGDT